MSKHTATLCKGSGNAIVLDCIKRGLRLNSDGDIVLPSGKIHSGKLQSNGYRRMTLWGLGRRLSISRARVVCWLAHGSPPEADMSVDHINRDRSDDRPGNLRWATTSENTSNVAPEITAARQAHCRRIRKLAVGDNHWTRKRALLAKLEPKG